MRFGITISKKVGKAVLRNKLKRWIRNILKDFSESSGQFSFDLNFVFKPVNNAFYKSLQFKEFREQVELALRKIAKSS